MKDSSAIYGVGRRKEKCSQSLIPEVYHQLLSEILKLGRSLFLIILVIGVLVIWGYYFSIKYYPVDLSINETFLFLCASFGFGTLYFLGVIYSCFSVIWLYNLYLLFSKKEESKVIKATFHTDKFACLYISLMSVFVCFFIFGLVYIFKDYFPIYLLIFVIQGLFILHFFAKKISQKVNILKSKLTFTLLFIFPLIVLPISVFLVEATFSTLGLRKVNSNVYIDKKYSPMLVDQGIELLKTNSTDKIYVGRCTVLSTGVGSQTYIKFELGQKVQRKIAFPTEDVFIVDK